jgi:hypothetical protein
VIFKDFYNDWKEALKPVVACDGCCAISLGQQVENPLGVVHIQPWMTLEQHIVDFKQRGDFGEMGPLSEVVGDYLEGGWSGFKACHLLVAKPGEA